MTNAELASITVSDWRAARYLLNRCRAIDAMRNRLYIDELPYPIDEDEHRRPVRGRNPLPLFAGRWLNNVKIPARTWLRIVELFTTDKPATFIAEEVGLGYPTVVRALDTIQSAIVSVPEDPSAPGRDLTCRFRFPCRLAVQSFSQAPISHRIA